MGIPMMDKNSVLHGVYFRQVAVHDPDDYVYGLDQDSLKKLREKPTVLTVEEAALTMGNVALWPEFVTGSGDCALLNPCNVIMDENDTNIVLQGVTGGMTVKPGHYGEGWRLWSVKPTDELRAMTPWKKGKDGKEKEDKQE